MGKKYNQHPTAEIRDGGKYYCTYCNKEIPESMQTEWPCTVSVSQPFDSEIEISVWNCQAKVLLKKTINNREEHLPIAEAMQLTPAETTQITQYAEQSVEAVGMINQSGIYPPNDALVKYINDLKLIKAPKVNPQDHGECAACGKEADLTDGFLCETCYRKHE
jgi:hypothetical protein